MNRYQGNATSYETTFLDPEEADEGFEKDQEEVLDPEDD